MASTSMTLGPHWEAFIRREIESGRFASASEVVRAGLRELEDQKKKIEALRAHVGEGLAQANNGDFSDGVTADHVIERAVKRAGANL